MKRPFVGRDDLVAALDAALVRARSAAPAVTVLLGEAGVGKTALLDHFLERAAITGDRVRRASGDEAVTTVAYDVIDQLFPELDRDPAADPPSIGARVLTELGDPGSDKGAHILIVDDAQWADTPSLQALGFVLHRLRADRVLAVVAGREVTPAMERLVRLAERPAGEILRLAGLVPAELMSLADALGVGPLPAPSADRLHAHTRGNPLHASMLLNEVPVTAFRDASVPLPAPRSYGLLVLSRLAACSPAARDLVLAASVLGLRC